MKAGDSEVSAGHTAHQIESTIMQSFFNTEKLFDYFYEHIKVLRMFPPNYP